MSPQSDGTHSQTLALEGDWQAELQTGAKLLGRYEFRRVLGKGAMGQVLEVHDTDSGLDYALKRVPPDIAVDPEQMSAIKANFSLVSQLTHPHIATLRTLEIDRQTGAVFLIMDLVRGEDLSQWMARKREAGEAIKIKMVLGIGEQIAAALDYAHAQPTGRNSDGTPSRFGIVHRDLKPANVMLESGREFRPGIPFVRVVDFGLAAEIQASIKSVSIQRPGNQITGTPYYMAPEQWDGKSITRGVDQWALAVMVYEMIGESTPFQGPNLAVIMNKVKTAEPEPLPSLSKNQWKALKNTFNKDRKLRYRSCLGMVKSLANADKSTADSVTSAEVLLPEEFNHGKMRARSTKPPTHQGAPWKWIAVAVVALFTAGGFWIWNGQRKKDSGGEASKTEKQKSAEATLPVTLPLTKPSAVDTSAKADVPEVFLTQNFDDVDAKNLVRMRNDGDPDSFAIVDYPGRGKVLSLTGKLGQIKNPDFCISLDPQKLKGRIARVSLNAFSRDGQKPILPSKQAQTWICITTPRGKDGQFDDLTGFAGARIRPWESDWQHLEFVVLIPADPSWAVLSFHVENCIGEMLFDDVKIELLPDKYFKLKPLDIVKLPPKPAALKNSVVTANGSELLMTEDFENFDLNKVDLESWKSECDPGAISIFDYPGAGKVLWIKGTLSQKQRPPRFIKVLDVEKSRGHVLHVTVNVICPNVKSLLEEKFVGPTATLGFRDKNGKLNNKVSDFIKPNQIDWTRLEFLGRIPIDATSLELRCELNEAIGDAFFDDIRVEILPDDIQREKAK